MEPEVQAETPVAATTADDLPASDESPESPKGAESAPAVKGPDEKKPSEGFTKRIDELTRDYRETERRLQAAERREQALIDRISRAEPKPEPPPEFQPKTLADFGYDEAKFQSHLIEEVRRSARTEAVQAARQELTEAQTKASKQERWSDFLSREEDFAKDLPDYHEVTRNDRLPLSEGSALFETVMDSEQGPAIAYYLGKNLRLADQISRLPALQQAREIGRIEARLSDKPKVPKVSAAPEPAAKIEALDPSVNPKPDSPDSDRMSDAAWLRARTKQMTRRT